MYFERIKVKTMSKSEFVYTDIDINKSSITNKPITYTGKEFPLRDLGDREFEILIYGLFKEEINNKRVGFDRIQLMSGIRDKAQDCILYSKNIKHGIIQCKHSKKDTTQGLKTCIEEIIKFILYSIEDKSLLPDINLFTYYFASSSGFETKTENYLRTFKTSIAKEKQIEKWSKNVIKGFTSIKVTYEDVKEELINKIESLKVELITPVDIQSLLKFYESSIVPCFFQVKLVTDNTQIAEVKVKVDEILKNTLPKKISHIKILKEFNEASIFLSNYKSTFSLTIPIKIERNVSKDILNWIKKPINEKEEPIAILKGSAGSGKSVLLNTLYHYLISDSIPVIAFKADEKSAESIIELENKLNLSISLETSMEVIAEKYQKVVVIIDQIDALSQTLSSNRDNLGTYIQLIEKLKKIRNLRIIVSVREYDLNYDPYLIPFKKYPIFNAGVLSDDEVNKVLTALKLSNTTPKLLKLLSTPLHLELFCQVYNAKEQNIKFHSLYDLYNELWSIKLETKGNKDFKKGLKNTVFNISSRIYELKGNLTVSSIHFDTEDIKYLKTEGLILSNNSKEVMFFHQTFYDYVFARQFVENEKNVIEYLNDNNQGLQIRSCLKIILAHVREQNPQYYKQLVTELLISDKVRIHIKQLVLNYLGFIEEPNLIENELVETVIVDTKNEIIFYEAINTVKWIEFFIEMGWANKYINSINVGQKNTALQVFIRNIDIANKEILEYLLTVERNDQNDNCIVNVLYFLNKWDNNAIKLFNKVKTNIFSNLFTFCHCIEKGMSFDEDWAFK